MMISGIAGPENVDNQLLPMVSRDVVSPGLTRSKIYDKLIYEHSKSF